MRWGIRLQVLLLALIPTLTITVLLVAYFTSTRLQDLEVAFRERGEAIALKLVPAVESGLYSEDRAMLQNLGLATLKHQDVIGVAFFNEKGVPIETFGKLTRSFHVPDLKPHASNRSSNARNPQLGPQLYTEETENSVSFIIPIIAYPDTPQTSNKVNKLNKFGNIVGWLKLELDTRTIHQTEAEVLINTSMILLFGLSLSGLFALQMGRNVARPILELSQAVERIREGDLTTRVRSSAYPELQILEQGFNTMAESLSNVQARLKNQVDQATASLRRSLETIEVQNLELEIARQAAEKTSQIKSELLADMSHEIRTPMNGVVGFINLLGKTELNDKQRDYVNTIQKSAKTLLLIINDILDYSKIEAGKLRIERHTMNIRECVEETLTLLAPHATEKSLILIPLIYAEVPVLVLGDSLRIKQVITNLVNNAIKFTDQGSVIVRVMLDTENSTHAVIRIAVTDTGIGLSSEQQQELFQAFHQVNQTNIHTNSGGTGLGLVICKKLVEQMQGEIGLESELGRGSTFWFTFEVGKVSQALPLQNTETLPEFKETGLDSLHILAVDDNPDNLKLITYLLMEHKIQVTAVESGEAAVNSYRHGNFDMILMDIRMPGMNGLEATRAIRNIEQQENRVKTPIIALTAHALISEQEGLLAAGVDDYLLKPVDELQLQGIIYKWIFKEPELKVIDWDMACKLAGNKQDLAQELFAKLCSALPSDMDRIQKAFEIKDWENLRDEVHRLHGACCYCGVPKLKRCLEGLETDLARGVKNTEQALHVETQITELNSLIEELLSETATVLAS